MQLILIYFAIFFFVITSNVKAQLQQNSNDPLDQNGKNKRDSIESVVFEVPDWQEIDINFLSSYYSQDGDNSPVTGGIGTEKLTDFTQKLKLSVPLNPSLKLNVDGGYDYYSSASTDNIDNIRSSDSSADMRVHGNVGLSYKIDEYKTLGGRIGGSAEYDYVSVNGGLDFTIQSKDRNTALSAQGQAFFDTWSLIYPQELRGVQGESLSTNQRRSYNGSLSISRILNKRMQVSVQVEGIYMSGLLSTPFHRVFFQGESLAGIERLPSSRFKIPIGIRWNTHWSEKLITRMYYRYYQDNWGITGHTASIEVPIKLNRFFAVYPYYRYHTQTASDYFLPHGQHSRSTEFYTSDYDLSAIQSHHYGLGLSYNPSGGIFKTKMPFMKNRAFSLKGIDLKVAHFDRSTGLTGNIISVGLNFSI